MPEWMRTKPNHHNEPDPNSKRSQRKAAIATRASPTVSQPTQQEALRVASPKTGGQKRLAGPLQMVGARPKPRQPTMPPPPHILAKAMPVSGQAKAKAHIWLTGSFF